jgi:hypothetical protein
MEPAGTRIVEVALRVGLEASVELVALGRGLALVRQALVEVGLAVAVRVVEDRDPVAAEDVDLAAETLRPRAGEPAAKPSSHVLEPSSMPLTSHTSPDGRDGRAAVRRKWWPLRNIGARQGFSYDGIADGVRVHPSAHAPARVDALGPEGAQLEEISDHRAGAATRRRRRTRGLAGRPRPDEIRPGAATRAASSSATRAPVRRPDGPTRSTVPRREPERGGGRRSLPLDPGDGGAGEVLDLRFAAIGLEGVDR